MESAIELRRAFVVWSRLLAVPLLCLSLMGMTHAQDAICAKVKIQLEQSAVLTRSAFAATLTIDNQTCCALEQVYVELDIRDANDDAANDLFGVYAPELVNLDAVDGTGTVAEGDTASATWMLVPGEDAAPSAEAVKYTVGGKLMHTQEGVMVIVPLYPVEIDVYPDAALYLDYYLQKQVYGDNTFTEDTFEPIEPFSLGLRVVNAGFGGAKNLTITSSQPKIIENQLGLLVAFKIIAAQLGVNPIQPFLTLELGDVPSGGSQVARWLLTCSLQGQFTEMSVDFEHVNGLGDPSLSLIKGADIHALVHVCDLDLPGVDPPLDPYDDDLPDFLVDLPDDPLGSVPTDPVTGQPMVDFPNVVHVSDGSQQELVPNDSAVVSHPPDPLDLCSEMQLTVSAPGWNYIRLEDPGDGAYDLVQVTRLEVPGSRESFLVGGPGDISNVWSTSRLMPQDGSEWGPPPYYKQRLVHLVDWFDLPGTYDYQLVYQEIPEAALSVDVDAVSVAGGGTQTMTLNAGPENAGRIYFMLGSASGTEPGFPISPWATVPLHLYLGPPLNQFDPYFDYLLKAPGALPALNFVGSLDSFGVAQALFVMPAGLLDPKFAGLRFHHAYVLLDPWIDFASNAVSVTLIP